MATRPTEQLAQLIRQKREVLAQLHQVGSRQGELVASGDVGSLLKLLAAKQRLLAGLQVVEKQIEPFREEDPEQRVWASPTARAACAADAQACRTLLAEVMEMEKTHEEQMTQRRDEVAAQLQRVHTSHDARGAYQANQHATKSPQAIAVDATPATGIDLTSEV